MSMLSDDELVKAMMVNLKSWNWDINSKFGIDETSAKALIAMQEKRENTKSDICDMYCKYPQLVHEQWLREEFEEDRDEYLIEHHCNDCPLAYM